MDLKMEPIIVSLEKPAWIQKETSIERVGYIQVFRFGVDSNTRCTNIANGQSIDPNVVSKGSPYGLYECRCTGSESQVNQVSSVSRFRRDDTTIVAAIGLIGLLTIVAIALDEED